MQAPAAVQQPVCFRCIVLTEHNLDARRPCIEFGHSIDPSAQPVEHEGMSLVKCIDCGTLVMASACRAML